MPFSGGLAGVATENGWGYINTSGNFVIQPQFRDAWPFYNGLAEVEFMDETWGYINKSGDVVWQSSESTNSKKDKNYPGRINTEPNIKFKDKEYFEHQMLKNRK